VRCEHADFHGFTHCRPSSCASTLFPTTDWRTGRSITGGEVFRIDHDQAFNQTTHFQYQPWKTLPWIAMNWRYDSGLVASNPNLDNFADASGFLMQLSKRPFGLSASMPAESCTRLP